METFKAFLDYFTLDEWRVIGIASAIFFWVLNKLTNRYFNRRAKRAWQAAQERNQSDINKH